uniref:Uncharacterized protein n=1 Tax=Spironucleus salmonicida TaxID=348837 RepID=V6LSZ0_9EUKA|eukprot:EST46811.1 Hypothetical protein SS50377_13175 [Spironucleus salmonicida]
MFKTQCDVYFDIRMRVMDIMGYDVRFAEILTIYLTKLIRNVPELVHKLEYPRQNQLSALEVLRKLGGRESCFRSEDNLYSSFQSLSRHSW